MRPVSARTNHKHATCPCVACRLDRGEAPNPSPVRGSTAARRSYLWLSHAMDHEVSMMAIRLGVSKAAVVRDAVQAWVMAHRED